MGKIISGRNLLLIVSGPAGSGKTTLCMRMCETHKKIDRVVTSTARAPRDGEKHGIDYYFFSPDEFEAKIEAGEFFEYARVHDRLYGTLKSEIHRKLESGRDILLNIDVQGAGSFRKAAQNTSELANKLVSIFVAPVDKEELQRRLKSRASDDKAEIARRLDNAEKEMSEWVHYDYFIHSGTRDRDFEQLLFIYTAEKLRVI